MPIILNIETATDICSICLSKDKEVIAFQESAEQYSHAGAITIFIDKVLQDAQIEMKDLAAVAISGGPGSYTALRIGTATAKGICYALDKPLIAIDTLQALALASAKIEQKEDALYFPMIDARRMEVYTAGFDAKGNNIKATEALIVDETAFQNYDKNQKIVFSGNGAAKCQSVLTSPNFYFNTSRCSSRHLVDLAVKMYQEKVFVDAAYFSPAYFKSPNITVPKKIL